MSQERWDVVLRFVQGPLALMGEQVYRGPVVRMGANPGPGGLKLEGYRALDDRQAVIQSYDGGTVSIAPVGTNQVRVAPHENQDWNEIPPIRGPVYLNPGAAFHLGPPGRGVTAVYVESQRLGVWEQQKILSEAADQDPMHQPSNVKALDAQGGRPWWFIPSMVMIGIAVSIFVVLRAIQPPEIAPIGPVDEGEEYYKFVDASVPLDPKLVEGFNAPFHDFVAKPNADAASDPDLAQVSQFDQKFLQYVTRSVQVHAKAWRFWTRLEEVRTEYAYVVTEMRENGLPEVFAGIPYQESGYRPDRTSPVCAYGWWQFMPEVGHRMGLQINGCKLAGSEERWAPTENIIPRTDKRVYFNAASNTCRIQKCDVDERKDLQLSTRASVKMFAEAYNDPELRAAGVAVQATILSHNMGYDDSRFNPNRKWGVLWSWRRYAQDKKLEKAPDFYGQNILCTDPTLPYDEKCGGTLMKETQHYAYNIVAQHILAVCYYAKNYGEEATFAPWRQYDIGEGYCTKIQTPDTASVLARGGGAR